MLPKEFTGAGAMVLMNINVIMANIVLRLFILSYRYFIIAVDVFLFFVRMMLEYMRLTFRLFVPREERSVAGEVTAITGAGSGLGRELALQLGKLNAIIICLDVDDENNKKTAELVKENGGIAFAYHCDVGNREQVDSVAKEIQNQVGDVNILINNAGIFHCRPFVHHTANQMQKVMQTNLIGHLYTIRAFLPPMLETNHGCIVAISAVSGHMGMPNMIPYAASKFGVKGLMEALYVELRQNYPNNHVHTMTVSPFVIDTGYVKGTKIRFPGLLNIVPVKEAASTIISNMRRRHSIVFLPAIYFYIQLVVRLLPGRVQLLLLDFIDTGIDVNYDEVELPLKED